MRIDAAAMLIALYLAPTFGHAWIAGHMRKRYSAAAAASFAQVGTTQTSSQNTGSSIVLTKPAGVANQTVVYAFLFARALTLSPIPSDPTPSGWVKVRTQSSYDSGTNILTVFRRISDGSDGASYTFTYSGSRAYSMGAVMAFSGLNTSSPEDVTPVMSSGTTSGTSVSISSITTATANAQVIAAFIDAGGATGLTAPGGYTSAWSVTNAPASLEFQGYQKTQVAAGSTGSISTGNWPNGVSYATVVLALRRL